MFKVTNLKMKNLLSRIAKPLLIPALALGLSTGIKAQNVRDENKVNENRLKFNLSFTFGMEGGVSYSRQKLLSTEYYSGDKIREQYILPQADMMFVLEPLFKKGKFEWGFPIYYGISNAPDLGIRTEQLYDKEEDEAFEQTIMTKKFPSFGISTRITRENKEPRLWLELLTYPYTLLDKNSLLDKKRWAQKATVGWFYDTRKDPDPFKYAYFGFYLERAHKFIETGFTFRTSLVGPPCTRPLHDCY
jgi:hypothetical protein